MNHNDQVLVAPRTLARSHSEPVLVSQHSRMRIYYANEELHQRSLANAHHLMELALTSESTSSTSAKLAKKALKYRKVWDRMQQVDIHSAKFNVGVFLGADWHYRRTDSDEIMVSSRH